MAAKTSERKTNAPRHKNLSVHKNGSQASNEHLLKANKAMEKAWTLISHRQNKRG